MSNIKTEAERCLKCKNARCAANCPVHTPIPEVTNLFLEGKIREAGELLFENNPMTAVTSVVCPHERNCYGNCVLGIKSSGIEFYKLEQYVSRFYLETYKAPKIEKNGIKVAVAGSGPAGLTMAMLLLKDGYDVTLFEALDKIGGVLRYGIPAFRLPKDYLDLYMNILLDMGVKFRPNTRIGTNLSIEDLLADGYKAVFVATGTGRPNKLGLLGETLGHVHFAIDYLKSPDSYDLGKKVAIVGAGNVAIDAARTAIRKHHSEATLLHFMSPEDMSANIAEIEMAEIDGAKFIHNCQAVRITDEGVRCVHVNKIVGEDGKVTFEEDFANTFTVEADSVIIAIGQGPASEMKGYNVKSDDRGKITANEFGETSMPGVFAAGDIVSGPRTVVEAVAFTQKVYGKLKEYLEK